MGFELLRKWGLEIFWGQKGCVLLTTDRVFVNLERFATGGEGGGGGLKFLLVNMIHSV